MNTWIFQANPDQFDLEALLASPPGRMTWLVRRYSDRIVLGDTIYLWLAKGKTRDDAAIVAEATVISPVSAMVDDEYSQRFWKVNGVADQVEHRVWIKLKRIANSREQIKRLWLKDDPILKDLLILKQANGTNYPVPAPQAARLGRMWACTGRDWDRAESIAGLWAYKETSRTSPSMKDGSPVSRIALLTGRALSGAYNKVMNFRSVDPNDERKGLSGLGEIGKGVWNEFFVTARNQLDEDAVDAEFKRLWGEATAAPSAANAGIPVPADEKDVQESVEAEVKRLATKSLTELLNAYWRGRQKHEPTKPIRHQAAATVYDRDPLVVAIAKKRADFRCEVPGCIRDAFRLVDGLAYVEVHHLVRLADGGEDSIENVACLCPHHHREIHLGINRAALTSSLRLVRSNDRDTTLQ